MRKKIKNRLLGFGAVLLALCCIFVNVSAEDFETALFELQSMGLVNGDENGDINADQDITGGELSALAVRLQNLESTLVDGTGNVEMQAYVDMVLSLGYVQGGAADFAAEGKVSPQMAAELFVNMLGYGYPAQELGGYPSGYMTQAGKLKLFQGVDQSQRCLKRQDVFMMAYNALDADRMVKILGTENEYQIQHGNTLRNELFDRLDYDSLTGIMVTTPDAFMYRANEDLAEDEVEIGGQTYRILHPEMKAYFGQEVEFFILDTQNARYPLITGMRPTDRNRVTQIPVRSLSNVEENSLSFCPENRKGKEQTLRFGLDTILVKNNEALLSWNASTLSGMKNGSITAIDNDGDGRINVFLATESTSAVVQELTGGGKTALLKDGYTLYGNKSVPLVPDSGDMVISITDAEGNPIEPEDIQRDDVISAFENNIANRRIYIVNQERVQGIITQIQEDRITVDDREYTLSDETVLGDFSAGDYVKAYVNYANEVIGLTNAEGATQNYGYILTLRQAGGFGNVEARLLLPATMVEQAEKDDNSADETATVNKLVARNSAIEAFPLSNRLRVGGSKAPSDFNSLVNLLQGKAVRFTESVDGTITAVEFPRDIDTGQLTDGSIAVAADKTYNSYEKTFGLTYSGAFGIDGDTSSICVPTNDAGTDDYLAWVEMKNGRQYTVKAFDMNEETHMAGLMVIQAIMQAGNEGVVNTSSEVGFVAEALSTMNEGGEIVPEFTVVTNGEIKQLPVSPDLAAQNLFAGIHQGELIAYSVDLQDRMDGYTSLSYGEALDLDTPVGSIQPYMENETFCGYVTDAEYTRVSNTLNRWVHRLYCSDEKNGGLIREFEVYKNNGPDIILYEPKLNRTSVIDVKEIDLNSDKVFISAANGLIRAIVAIR